MYYSVNFVCLCNFAIIQVFLLWILRLLLSSNNIHNNSWSIITSVADRLVYKLTITSITMIIDTSEALFFLHNNFIASQQNVYGLKGTRMLLVSCGCYSIGVDVNQNINVRSVSLHQQVTSITQNGQFVSVAMIDSALFQNNDSPGWVLWQQMIQLTIFPTKQTCNRSMSGRYLNATKKNWPRDLPPPWLSLWET